MEQKQIVAMDDQIIPIGNYLELRSVSQIQKNKFFIPDYQRGYRWTERQVRDLLNDITNFNPEQVDDSDDRTWYCLQPIVLKKCSSFILKENDLDSSSEWYEVIDGQQRLTTIFLIGHYVNEMWRGKEKDPEMELKFKTRERSTEFLENLRLNEDGEVEINKTNIDFFHISSAYKTINDWIKDHENEKFRKDNFIAKFLNDTKVIWFESNELDPIAIFKRINLGKIPLTNAELIKALFLNSSNFKNKEDISLKQLEIASEWDRIEYALQNDSFWYFINEGENKLDTRIEFIFNLMAEKPAKEINDYFTFQHFSKKFSKHTYAEVVKNWDEIKRYYQTLDEWFTDRELYHKVGFLIATGEKIMTLTDLCKNRSKQDFKDQLTSLMRQKVKVQLADLEYPRSPIKPVLLLHNIQTMLDNEVEDSKFPFDRYKKENWDIEHINSVAENIPSTDAHKKDWLNESLKYLKENKDLEYKVLHFDGNEFQKLFEEILDYFNERKHDDDTNGISNLVLLDARTNRGYKNSVFPVKREKIIEKDKNGTFIPICTRNVFMKFYSNDVEQMTFWGVKERSDYYDDIKRVIGLKYLPVQNEDIIHE